MDELRCIRSWLDSHIPMDQHANGDQCRLVFLRDHYLDWCCLRSLRVTGESGIKCTFSKLSGMVNMLEGRDAIQKDPDRLETWACEAS